MKGSFRSHRLATLLGVVLVTILAFSVACAAEAKPTPVPPSTPVPAVAPTQAPAPAATATAVSPAAPILAQPTPTRVLPTPTATPKATTGAQYGGTLRYAAIANFVSMDPNFSQEFIDRYAYYVVYNSLVKYAPDFSLLPELAKSWQVSADGKDVTFKLQEGVKFHDGTDFNADAVKWNFDYLTSRENASLLRSTIVNDVTSLEVVDKYTVVYRFKNPFRPLLSDLGERPGFMISPTAVQKLGGGRDGKYGRQPSGTGPFKFGEWILQNRLVLERNDKYWEVGKPYLDKIVFLHVPDYTARVAMVRTGDADITDGVRAEDKPILERNPNVRVVEHQSGRYYGIRISVDKEPWSNKNLRAAIAYAIDRKTLIDAYYGGAGRSAYIPEGAGWAFNPDIKVYDYDPQKAKEKLTEAGYPKGITFDYWCGATADENVSPQLCEMVQAMLSRVGINANIVLVPIADYFQKQVRRESHFNHTFFSPRADPHGRLFRVFHSKGASNITGYNNPEVDKLLEDAARVYDIAKAKPLYDRAQRLIAEDATTVFTIHGNIYAAMTSSVQNFVWIPDLVLRFGEIWLKR